MSLCDKSIDLSSWTVTVTEVTSSPAVADFAIVDSYNLLSEPGLIRSILSAAIGQYLVENSLTVADCSSGSCDCPVGPAGTNWYFEAKKARFAFTPTDHTIGGDDLTVTAPFEWTA